MTFYTDNGDTSVAVGLPGRSADMHEGRYFVWETHKFATELGPQSFPIVVAVEDSFDALRYRHPQAKLRQAR